MNKLPDIEAFEERAAIIEYDGDFSREQSEDMAAKAQGYLSAEHYRQSIIAYLKSITPCQ